MLTLELIALKLLCTCFALFIDLLFRNIDLHRIFFKKKRCKSTIRMRFCKFFVKFDDEQTEKKDENTIDDEIKKIVGSADALIKVLEKIAPEVNSDKVVNPEAFLKIIKPLCVSVENTLPMLMECQDNLEYLKDDNAYVLRQKVAHIEDDLLPPLLAYIRDHDKKKE